MAKTAVLTASGLVKTGVGAVYKINLTKTGSADATVDLFDNTTNSGTKIFSAAGSTVGSNMLPGSYDLQGDTEGATVQNGIYVAIAGTTAPIVQVVYD